MLFFLILLNQTELRSTEGTFQLLMLTDQIDPSLINIILIRQLILCVLLVAISVINPSTIEYILLENGYGDQNLLIIKDPKILGFLKETNLFVLQEQSKKTNKKGMCMDI